MVATLALNRDCHLVTLGMSLATAGEATTGLLDLHRRGPSVEEMGIGRGTEHRSGMNDANGGALGLLMGGIGDTEARAHGPVARTKESLIYRSQGGLQEMCPKYKSLSLKRSTGRCLRSHHPTRFILIHSQKLHFPRRKFLPQSGSSGRRSGARPADSIECCSSAPDRRGRSCRREALTAESVFEEDSLAGL